VQAVRKSTGASRELQLLRALAHAELNKVDTWIAARIDGLMQNIHDRQASTEYATKVNAVGGVLLTEATVCRTCKKPFTGALSGCRLYRGRAMEAEHVHCLSNE
jgi:hypothetical protein